MPVSPDRNRPPYIPQTRRPTQASQSMLRHMRHLMTEEAAYFHWLNRGHPLFEDPLEDWGAAEKEVTSIWPVLDELTDLIAESLRHLFIAERAYLRWLNQGGLFGDPLKDWYWFDAEAMLTTAAESWLQY